MKIIVPMAGKGKRMRPHTLTLPKPLIPIAGTSIVERLVTDIAEMTDEPIEEVAYVIGDFGKETEDNLKEIAQKVNAKGTIYYQDEALGTAHAIFCAAPSLSGNLVVAFADTLFTSGFKIDPNEDGIVWVKKIDDPSQFGVVETQSDGTINNFAEKPEEYISDLAIIGVYYFKDGKYLKDELQYLIDNDIKDKGEYQLTNAMENMKNKGSKLKVGQVNDWMDCGNKDVTVDTNKRILEVKQEKEKLVSERVNYQDAVVIEPCYIGDDVSIERSVVGPYVSIGEGTKIEDSVITNSLILNQSTIKNSNLDHSMLGNHVHYQKDKNDLNLGDYTKIMR